MSVQLVALVAATVTVLDEAGRPAAGVDVEATPTDDRFGGRERARVRTDEAGKARLEGLVPGATHRLDVTRGDRDPPAHAARVGWVPEDVVVRLAPLPVVRGKVTDPEGRPVGGAVLFARSKGEPVGISWTAADGTFVLQLPVEGTVDVQALPPFDAWSDEFVDQDLGSAVVAGTPGGPLTLVVRKGVATSARLVGEANAEAWTELQAHLTREKEPWDPAGSEGGVAIEREGRLRMPPLLAGARYRFWLPAGGTGRCALFSFTAREGLVLDVRPTAAGSVRGRVRAPQGEAPPYVAIQGRGFSMGEHAAADGTFEVAGVPIGEPFDVVATVRVGGVEWTARVASRAGAWVELEPTAPRPK
jgi:hypothetical protein